MKILAVSDEEDISLWNIHGNVAAGSAGGWGNDTGVSCATLGSVTGGILSADDLVKGTDLIISCGDLKRSYLEYLITMINAPLLYVYGNHDTTGPEGGTCIDGRICSFGGLKFLGLGGCMRYRLDCANMYTEREMLWRVRRLWLSIWLKGGVDVLVTHAPAKGWGDLGDLAHRGFEAFNGIMTRYRPRLMLHGHVHMSYGRIRREYVHTSGTRIINTCGYRIVNIDV